MKRIFAVVLALVVAAPAGLWAQGWPSYTMPLVGRDGSFISVDHTGAMLVTPGPIAAWMIGHVSSVAHVAGVIRGFGPQGTNVVDLSNAALQVNCVVGCGSGGTQAHITSVTHVAGVIRAFGPQATDLVDAVNVSLRVSQGPARWPVSHVTSVTHVTLGRSPQFTMMVANCGTGASTVLQSNPNRRKLILQNSGQAHIAVGGGHVTVTIANGFLLMSATTFPAPALNVITGWNNARLELDDYQGPIQCIGQGANQRLDIIQVIQP